MKTIDLDSPMPDEKTMLKHSLNAWQLRKQARLTKPERYDSQVWFGESITGLELAMEADAPELTTRCLSECLALACASVVATAMSAQSLRVTLVDEPEFVCQNQTCLPRQWLAGLMAAVVADDRARLSLLASAFFEEITNDGEAFAESFGIAFCTVALAQPGQSESIMMAAKLATSDNDQALVNSLTAIQQNLPIDYQYLNGLESLSLSTLAHWLVKAGEFDDENHLNSPEPELMPEISCQLPVRAVLHDREPHWFFDLYGYKRSGRKHSLVTDSDNALLANYTIKSSHEMPGVEASFELVGINQSPKARLALDAGELLFLSDWYLELSDSLAQSVDERKEQQYCLENALETLNAILLRIPADEEQVPVISIKSALGKESFDTAPDRFTRQSLQTVYIAYKNRQNKINEAQARAVDTEKTVPKANSDIVRHQALTTIEILKDQLSPILYALSIDRTGEVLANLLPQKEDYAKAFVGEAVDVARQYYVDMSIKEMTFPSIAQSQLLCHLAPAGMFESDNELSRHFPGGYRGISSLLNPHRVWVRWKYVRPGESSGMAYDGLVWLDDHWAWFPKPYRPLASLARQ